jgi:ribonucleoside-triphosphate reductase
MTTQGQLHLAEMTMRSRYSRPRENGTLESWDDIVDRVMNMHRDYITARLSRLYGNEYEQVKAEMCDLLNEVSIAAKAKRIFPSGRTLQFGGVDLLKHNARNFNCAGAFASSTDILYKSFYLLLCGCGVGLSIQKHHVAMMPSVVEPSKVDVCHYTIPDSIEGWATALRVLFAQYFTNDDAEFGHFHERRVVFDYSAIRPRGSKISTLLGSAPGPQPLMTALNAVRSLLDSIVKSGCNRLRPVDIFDIMGLVSECVLAGGVRRSAMLLLFSADDNEMANSKIGDWWRTRPHRARANISALVLRKDLDDPTMSGVLENCKQFGEPGLILADDTEMIVNPCAEISLYPVTSEGEHCFEFCNLVEINAAKCDTPDSFVDAARLGAILGTCQALYTDIPFLGEATRQVIERSRLVGVSITGVMENTKIALDPATLERGAEMVRATNDHVADLLKINPAHRLTTIKPSGTASVVLGLSGCGIHPSHADRYIRHVRCKSDDPVASHFIKARPNAVNRLSDNEIVLAFPVKCVKSRTKESTSAVELLAAAKLVQKHWVLNGHVAGRQPAGFLATNNVSLTVNIKSDEWSSVGEYILENKSEFTGVSFLGTSGDVDYEFAPFVAVWSEERLIAEFGIAILYAGRVIVVLKEAFDESLFTACAAAAAEEAKESCWELSAMQQQAMQKFKSFVDDHFWGDTSKAIMCLKRVDTNLTYRQLRVDDETMGAVDWTTLRVDVSRHSALQAKSRATISCSGGSCVLTKL